MAKQQPKRESMCLILSKLKVKFIELLVLNGYDITEFVVDQKWWSPQSMIAFCNKNQKDYTYDFADFSYKGNQGERFD